MRKLIMPEQSWKVEDAKNEETETPSTSNPVDPAKLSFSYARIWPAPKRRGGRRVRHRCRPCAIFLFPCKFWSF